MTSPSTASSYVSPKVERVGDNWFLHKSSTPPLEPSLMRRQAATCEQTRMPSGLFDIARQQPSIHHPLRNKPIVDFLSACFSGGFKFPFLLLVDAATWVGIQKASARRARKHRRDAEVRREQVAAADQRWVWSEAGTFYGRSMTLAHGGGFGSRI